MKLKHLIALFLISTLLLCALPTIAGAVVVPRLISGDEGNAVTALQAVLKDEGYYTGAESGKYDAATVTAVKKFQNEKRLVVDGKAGVNTLSALGLYTADAKELATGKTSGNVNMRRGASTSHRILYKVAKGTSISIIGYSANWCRVRTDEGIEGFVLSDYITVNIDGSTLPQGKAYEGKVINITSSLNMRAAGDINARIVGSLTNGTVVYILAAEGDWYNLRTASGMEGYCSVKYISNSGKLVDIPAVQQVNIPDYTLKRGMTNGDVKQMQERLQQLGYFSATQACTGYFGTTTYDAVKKFQAAKGLKQDGIAGNATLTALYSIESNNPGSLRYDLPPNILRKGADNNYVKVMQQRLADLKFFESKCTGYYGDDTVEAVKLFQKRNNLAVDGVAGPKTLTVMYSADAIGAELTPSEKLELKINTMIAAAKAIVEAEIPYVRGGNGPDKFDCSGFSKYMFVKYMDQTNAMPRTAYAQGYTSSFGRKITKIEDLKKGDLVFFDTDLTDSDKCDHVGIYIGNNQFIHASSSLGKVVEATITKKCWSTIFSWGKRILE